MVSAVTSTAVTSPTANTALNQWLWDMSEPNLLSNTILWQFGTEAMIPPNQGLVAHIPRTIDSVADQGFKSASFNVAATDLRSLTFASRIMTLQKYTDAYGVEDLFAHGVRLKDYLERGALFLQHGLARRMETEIMDGSAISGNGIFENIADANDSAILWVAPDNSTAFGSVPQTALIQPEAFAKAAKKLRQKNAMGLAKFRNRFVAAIGPETTFQLQTNIGANRLSFEDSSMNLTQAYKDFIRFDLFGIMMFETTFGVKSVTATVANEYGLANTVTAEINAVLAADAYYTSELANMPAQMITKPFGSGGAVSDPADEYASVSIKAAVGYAPGDLATRVVQIPVPTT